MSRLIAIAATLSAFAFTAATASANSNLVGQWRLDQGGGTVAADSSGFGDNGNLLGPAAWIGGPGGGALEFDGALARVVVPDAPQLDPTNQVSVSAWIERVGSPGAYKYVLSKGGHGCIAASYGLYSGPNGGLQFYISRGHGTIYARSPDADQSVWDGRWHLAVGTFDGNTIKLYVDGVEVGTGTVWPRPIEYQLSDSNDLYIGAYPSCGEENFAGAISDVRIWNTALTSSEVNELGQTAPPPPSPSPSGGNPTAPSGQQTPGTPTGGAGSTPPPMLRALKLVGPTFSAAALGQKSVITYADSQPARVTFTLLRFAPRARCPRPARPAHRKLPVHCPRYVKFGKFTHRDHSGSNRLRIPSRFWLPPGKYELEATPTFGGTIGRTLTIAFTVTR